MFSSVNLRLFLGSISNAYKESCWYINFAYNVLKLLTNFDFCSKNFLCGEVRINNCDYVTVPC